jgi:hypothetical protein
MLAIKDLVTVDEQAEFRNDVQLSSFDDPDLNLALLRSYLFSASEPGDAGTDSRVISTVRLLERIKEAFLSERSENRLVAIADYGHGKSHLALAFANYFSRPTKSTELTVLLTKLDSAVADPARSSQFHDFKQSQGEFLVVRLRGDMPGTLREQFLAGLRRALGEHEATRTVFMPFWFTEAESFLQAILPEERAKADAFLAQRDQSLALLLDSIGKGRDVYGLCREVFKHLRGYLPDFGGEVALASAVSWAAESFCGEGKPLGGMLILFDEFSRYVRRSARANAAGDLQDLLNGVESQRRRVVFLAFALNDPVSVANDLGLGAAALGELLHELTRLPDRARYTLYTLLESVIHSYLRQSDVAWARLLEDRKVRPALASATDIALISYTGRYERILHWNLERFQEVVGKGCFPLHPLTTTLLCNLRFSAGDTVGVPRTVLGFIMQELEARSEQPAIVEGRINWVLPIRLVEYFESRLSARAYQAYEGALAAAGDGITQDHKRVLQALLLQEAAVIDAKGRAQISLVAEAVGLGEEEARQGMKSLAKANTIRYDDLRDRYLLRASTERPDLLQEYIALHDGPTKLDAAALAVLHRQLHELRDEQFDSLLVDVPWGNSKDWAASEVVITPELLAGGNLRPLLSSLGVTFGGPDDPRGATVWLVSRDEEEADWLKQNAGAALDASFPGDSAPPIVMIQCRQPCPELIDSSRRLHALGQFTTDEREKVGPVLFGDADTRTRRELGQALRTLRGDSENFADRRQDPAGWSVPMAYRASIAVLAAPTLRNALLECYRLAYRYRPPSFFKQYKAQQIVLRDAVKEVAGHLLRNNSAGIRDDMRPTKPVIRDMCQQYLQGNWHLLTQDMRIQAPESIIVRQAWDLLDTAFKPGGLEMPVKGAFLRLFTMPYGFDYNTATLLFCAWYGLHAPDLTLSVEGRLARHEVLESYLLTGPKHFVGKLCVEQTTAIRRRNPGAEAGMVGRILQRAADGTFTQEEADRSLIALTNFINRADGTELQAHAERTKQAIERGLAEARTFDIESNRIKTEIQAASTAAKLLSLQTQISTLPQVALVIATGPQPAELRSAFLTRLREVVDALCRQLEVLERSTQLELNEARLQSHRAELARHGLQDLVRRVDTALEVLKKSAEDLRKREQEAGVVAEIKSMDLSARLPTLNQYKARLQGLTSLSSATGNLRDEKLGAVTNRIAVLEQQAKDLCEKIRHVTSRPQLAKWQGELASVQALLSDTVYEGQLKDARGIASEVDGFLGELATYDDRTISSPADAESLQNTLLDLRHKHEEVLGPEQAELVVAQQARIAAQVNQKRDQVVPLLVALEVQLLGGRPRTELVTAIRLMASFLPVPEQTRWLSAQRKMQEQLDSDVIARIEIEFRKIGDRRKRDECLSRLQQIAAEGTGN